MSVTVSEQVPLLAAAPNGIKKLRELILELAVRGKLVAQDSSDEPASELLKRVAVEKKRLVKDGKSNALKPLAEIEEEPFELPDGWEWVRFGEIVQHNSGKTLDSGRNTGHPRDYITTSNLYWGRFELENVRQMLIRDDEMERCVARKNDLLICEGGEAGRAAVWEKDSEICFQNHIHRARLFVGISPYFAYRLFEKLNATGEINQFRKGVAISNMSGKALASIPFPLPPIAEQHRIVAKVDELMALCDRLEEQQTDAESAHAQLVATLLDSLTRSSDADDFAASWQRLSAHFHTLFTTESSIDALKHTLLQLAVMGKLVPQDSNDEPASELLKRIESIKLRLVEEDGLRTSARNEVPEDEQYLDIPNGWAYSRLGNLARFIDYRGRTPNKVPAGVPLITAKNVRFGFVSREPREFIAEGDYASWMTRGFPRVGDMLFTTEAPLGNIALVDIPERFALAQRVICFQLHELGTGPFLRLAIMSGAVQSQFGDVATGMTATGIKASRLKEIPIPLPPLAEQHRIVAKVDQLITLCNQLSAAIQRRNQHSRHLADAFVDKALSPVSRTSANVVDLSCYLVDRLVAKPTFGRTTHMKLIYLADTHLGFNFQGEYMREAAGPLDKNIYQVEKQAAAKGWYTHTLAPLKSGVEKVTYHATDTLAAKARQVAEALGDKRQGLDQLIALLGDKKTEEVEIVATLFAAWNDALLDGQSPSDEWIIREVRENWHVEKQRFTAEKLGHWLDWMRKHHLVPTGKPPRTQQQVRMFQ